ncbi:CAP domain-containing protein [Vreelandella sp. V005]|uniref:CAP domain-containing protein n=1 Tax=Vreelandella sp. V005 TaxID=3459608 RepID=UPI0040447CC7
MKNLVANRLYKHPAFGVLFSLAMLMGASSALASGESNEDDASAESQCELTDQKQAMLSLINEARSQQRRCGEQPFEPVEALAWNCKLEAAAERHAQDMAENDYFSHTAPDGSGIEQRINYQDYVWQAVGENIAAGHTSPSAVVEGWLASSGHCQNIMNGTFTEMGMAKARNPQSRYGTYWTQTLGNSR